MNMNLIAQYLQFLRKSHNYTQDELAQKLNLSRQAVSKWETAATLPDPEVLLALSKLYGITINDILEPDIQPRRITDFEQITAVPEQELRNVLTQFDSQALMTALMGASPEVNSLCERLFPDAGLAAARDRIGSIRIESVEEMQKQIVCMINLQAVSDSLPAGN